MNLDAQLLEDPLKIFDAVNERVYGTSPSDFDKVYIAKIKNTMRPPRLESRGLGTALVFWMFGD